MKRLSFGVGLLLAAPVLGACGGGGAGGSGGGGDSCDFSPLTSYEAPSFEANADIGLQLHEHWEALEGLMVAAEADPMVKPTAAELTAGFEAGSPSLRDATFAALQQGILGLFDEFAAAAGNTWAPADPPSGPGGSYGTEGIFASDGILLREGVEKSIYVGALWAHGLSLLDAGVDDAGLDEVLAVFGAHPAFAGDSESGLADGDDLLAKYAERRSAKNPTDPSKPLDPAAPGPYFRIKGHFITARGALGAGTCQAALEGAVAGIKAEIEIVGAATALYYLNRASLLASDPAATEGTLSEALAAYSEAAGFLAGLRALPATSRAATDAELDGLLDTIGAPVGAQSKGYLLVTDPGAVLGDLAQGVSDLVDVYGFSPAEVASYKQAY